MLSQVNVQDVVVIAKEAGKAIMQIYKQNFEIKYKQDNSPLTLADQRANNIIKDGLSQLLVSFPVLSEEDTEIPYEKRRHWDYFWLIDPLDGTKEFVKKNDEFTVNIALIYRGEPVLGVVYAPALDVCYWSKQGEGAFKNGQRLPLKTESQRSTYKIVVSRSHMSDETYRFIRSINTSKEKELVSIGSSLKICLVAEGEADIYPRLGPTFEWDIGAAHAIARESNSSLKAFNNNGRLLEHRYNKQKLLNRWFVVKNEK